MSQLVSIESVLRPVISAAFKSLETKTYDTSREDYMDVLLEDLFQILFPHNATTTATPVATTTTVTTGAGQVIEKKKPGPKPKKEHPPLPPSPVNIQKVDPTLRKKLNDAAKKYKIKYTRDNDAEFLEWANRLTPEEFKELNDNDKLAEQYFVNQTSTTTVAAPSPPNPPQPPPTAEEETETQLKEVFGDKGESYWVDTQTGRIYEGEGEVDKETGAYSNYKPLGYVGEGPFKNIKV